VKTALVVSTQPRGFAARMPARLRAAGFAVHAACARNSLLRHSGALDGTHILRQRHLSSDLAAVLRTLRPDALVPADDIAAACLMQLHAEADLADLIASCLGNPASYAIACSKSAQMKLAASLGVPVPHTEPVADLAALEDRLQRQCPLVLKSDGSWGGTGVVVIRDRADAAAAWATVSKRPSIAKSVAACIRDRSILPLVLRRDWRSPNVDGQELVVGRPANRAVLCREGRVLAGVSVDVLETSYPGGPASVIRLIDHARMASTTTTMVEALGLSGYLGFDFMLDDATGEAKLIEMNPRATPVAGMAVGGNDGATLAEALFQGAAVSVTTPPQNTIIAQFPGEWERDPASHYLNAAWHDVPWEDPGLFEAYVDDLTATQRYHRFKSALLSWRQT